ncbi:MAG: LamG domain-containing protein, partial [Planctomycetota bacterium]
MKFCLRSVLFLLGVNLILTSASVAQQFQRAIGTQQEERSEWIASTNDGGTVICGFQNGSTTSAYVVKLDATGATQWDTLLLGTGIDIPNRVVQTADGGYALAGETSSGPAGFGISLIRLDASGNYLWSRCFDGTAFAGGSFGQTGLEETTDRGFILCGRKQQTAQAAQEGVLIRTDPNGNLMWERYYRDTRFDLNAFTSFADVHQTEDEGFIVTGYTAPTSFGSRDTVLMKTDNAGNVSWFKTYGRQDANEGGFNCEPAQNGDYIVTGFSKDIGEGGGTYFLRTDPVGNLLVYRTYRFFNGGHSMYETPSGDVIIAGNALDFATFDDASLMNVDGSGSLNWCMAYGDNGTGQEFGESVALMPGGGYQIAAWTNVFGSGNFDIYTVRTNNAGVSSCNERPFTPLVGQDQPPVMDVEIEIQKLQEGEFYQMDWTRPRFNNLDLCDDEPQGGCVEPPTGMVAWYPLDNAEPSPLVHELAFNNQGAPFNGTFPSGGMVNGAAQFDGIDDYYEAPNAPQINFGTGDFSMDAWVRTSDASGTRVLLDKRVEAGAVTGYSLFTLSGNLSFQLADTVGFTNYVSSAFIADDEWHLIAVTVDRDNVGVFYVDGVAVGTFNPTGRTGSVTNTGALRLAARSSSNTGNWEGRMDEVELFDRVLTVDEILGIYNAGPDGKCRDQCHAKWDVPFCLGENSVITSATICNNGTSTAMYSLSLNGLSASDCGNINGPTSFTILDPLPVTVNPGDCATVSIRVDRPTDMNSVYDIGCFETVWTNLTNGFTTTCTGSVIDRRDICAVITANPVGVSIAVDELFELPISISDPTGLGSEVEVQIVSMRSDMDPNAPSIVSLDGLPPGEPVVRTVKLPPEGTADLNIDVRYLDHEPFVFYDIILMVADDNGNFIPSDSIAYRTLA